MVYARGNGMSEAARAQRGNASVLKTEGTGWDVGHAVKFLLSDYAPLHHRPGAGGRRRCHAARPGTRFRGSLITAHSKKLLGRDVEQDLPDRLEMSAACLDLLRERVHVAEAALERAVREDRVDACSLVSEVCHLGRRLDGVGAGEPHASPVGDLDRRHTVGMCVDRGERLDQIGAPSRASARATSACTTALSASRIQRACRQPLAKSHLPVAASGGPLAFVRTGDRIRISVADRRIDLLVDEVELAQRRQTTKRAASVPSRGYARLFHREILLADEGCDFRSLTAHPTHD
jgi:Dehydratase family